MNPRPFNIAYLVVGLVFVGLASTWLLNETGVINPDGFQWMLPAILLGAGLIGLSASLGKGLAGRRHRSAAKEPQAAAPLWVDTPPAIDLTSDLDQKLADQDKSDHTPGATS